MSLDRVGLARVRGLIAGGAVAAREGTISVGTGASGAGEGNGGRLVSVGRGMDASAGPDVPEPRCTRNATNAGSAVRASATASLPSGADHMRAGQLGCGAPADGGGTSTRGRSPRAPRA